MTFKFTAIKRGQKKKDKKELQLLYYKGKNKLCQREFNYCTDEVLIALRQEQEDEDKKKRKEEKEQGVKEEQRDKKEERDEGEEFEGGGGIVVELEGRKRD